MLHRIKKQKIHSFAKEGANLNSTDKNKIMEVKMEHDLFGSILFLALQWKIDMGEILKFPLTPVPLCLAHIDGSIQETKTSLLKELETRVISEAPFNTDTLVTDGMLFLRRLKELPETFGLPANSILKKVCAVSNDHRIDLIFDKTVLLSIKDCKRDKRCQNESRHIMYEIIGPGQKQPNTALHNVYFKDALVNFVTSTWSEEKYVTMLQSKELRVKCEYICFLYRIEKGKMTKTEDKRLWCNQEEADTKILFHVGHLITPSNVVVRTADNDVLIIALANMKKLPAGRNA